MSFRPYGEKIASYTRVRPNREKKGKGAVVTLPEDDPNAIVYEVWHVRVPLPLSPVAHPFDDYIRQRGKTLDSENITSGCNCSFFSTSRLVPTSTMRRIRGSLSFCEFAFPGSLFPFPQYVRVLMRIDTKSANGGRHRSQRHIILWDTPRCTPSTAFQTRSAFD
jgi:hypothetical protein